MHPVLLLFPAVTLAANYKQNAEDALKGLQGWYNRSSGIWDTCGWWNGANCMTVIADLAAADPDVLATATDVFANTYTAAPASNPAHQVHKKASLGQIKTTYGPPGKSKRKLLRTRAGNVNVDDWVDSCYDDNSWWALAWIAAYDITKNGDYLATAKGIFDDNLSKAGPTNCSNGGVIWCGGDENYYVNAITNELYLSVAAHLANRIPDQKSQYVQKAQDQWKWFLNSGMINSENLINDGLELDCTNNGKRDVWSYNQGVILSALVELNRAAPDSSLIDWANKLAAASITNLTDSNHVVHEKCEPDCGGDGTQFKGAYMRGLQALQQTSPSDAYKQVILASADSIWAKDRETSNNTLSVDWDGPFAAPVNASTQSAAMDALVAALAISSYG